MREYHTVHGFEPARGNTEKLDEVRRKGGDLGGALNHAGQPHEHSNIVLPEYSNPVQNMKAAEAAAAELPHLQGEELHHQARRVQELIAAANRQQRKTEATASREHHEPPPGYDAAGKTKQGAEASSTSHGRAKDKQPRAHREGSSSSHPRDHGRDPAGRREDGNRNGPQTLRSVKERIGHKVTIDERLGPLGPETSHDARLRIDAQIGRAHV